MALAGAALVLWLSGTGPGEPVELARGANGLGTPPPAGTAGCPKGLSGPCGPGWTQGGGQPLAASAGPQRFLNGDWNLPGPQVDRTLIKPAEEPEAPAREAHVIPQAPPLRLMAPFGLAPASSRATAPAAAVKPIPVAAAPPAASTATARAATPEPPVAKRRRTLIPIPEAAKYGVREASARPVFKSEFPIPPGTTLQEQPAAIALDPNQAVMLIDRYGDGYLTPVAPPSAKNAGRPQIAAGDPRFIRIDPNQAVAAGAPGTAKARTMPQNR